MSFSCSIESTGHSSVEEYEDSDNFLAALEAHPIQKAGVLIFNIGSPLLILLGTIGNILVLVVTCQGEFATTANGLLLSLLAVSDMSVLYSQLLRQWIQYVFNVKAYPTSDLGCQITIYILYVTSDISSWTILLITVERAIVVNFPLRAKVLITRWRTLAAWLSVFLAITVINCYVFISMEYFPDNCEENILQEICHISSSKAVWSRAAFWLDITLWAIIPFILICVLNTSIIIKMHSQRKKRMVMEAITNNKVVSKTSVKSSHITRMMIGVNLAFCITIAPITVIDLMTDFGKDVDRFALHILIGSVADIILNINYATNFLLYCAFGSKFRQNVKVVFSRKAAKPAKRRTAMTVV